MVSIHDKLSEVDGRLVPRHWEGDLIKCKGNRTSVGMIVERTTLFTELAKMESATAASAINGFSHALNLIEGQNGYR
jgi:IS30 family transposase